VRPQPRVLVIEDSQPVGEILRCALEQEGCCVLLARAAHDGLELARGRRPDAIVLDLGGACDDVAAVVRAVGGAAARSVPIVALSARVGDLAPGLDARVTRIFGEPFYPAEVVAAVLEALDDVRASTMARPAIRR
jgi:two-component system, OmpR family, alkaline phosphatase synthesis response regulator PhoP